jgi:hypothetical protein
VCRKKFSPSELADPRREGFVANRLCEVWGQLNQEKPVGVSDIEPQVSDVMVLMTLSWRT